MTVDVSQVVVAVNSVVAAVAAIAGAVLVTLVGLKVWRWIASSIDAAYDDPGEEDEVAAVYESGDALACENCDYQLDEDEAYSAIDHGYCPKCGHEVM